MLGDRLSFALHQLPKLLRTRKRLTFPIRPGRFGSFAVNLTVPQKHFIQMPPVAKSSRAGSNPPGIASTELQTPLTDAFIANCDAAFCHHFFDVSVTERESKIKPCAMADDYGRKAIAAIGW